MNHEKTAARLRSAWEGTDPLASFADLINAVEYVVEWDTDYSAASVTERHRYVDRIAICLVDLVSIQ